MSGTTLPGLLVTQALDVAEFLGKASPFLEFPTGKPTFRLETILSPRLRPQVLDAVAEAARVGRAERQGIDFSTEAAPRRVGVTVDREVLPSGQPGYRILFEERRGAGPDPAEVEMAPAQGAEHAEMGRLRQELKTSRETVASLVEDGEKSYRALAEEREAGRESRRTVLELRTSHAELEIASGILEAALTASQESEGRLRESEERFARFMENLPGLAWVKDHEGRYVYANRAAEAAFHFHREEIYGKTDLEIFPAETARQFQRNDRPALLNGKAIQTIEALEHADGIHYSIVSKFPICDAEGRPSLVGGVAIDITERRRAEEALRRNEQELADFFENASVGIHWVGPDGIILRANQAELDMLGYVREEYVGHHITEFHADQPTINEALARLAKGETLREFPARMRRKDGSIRDVLINSNVLFEAGRFVHSHCFMRDVTDIKQAHKVQASLAAIVESSGDAIVSKSIDGIIQSWNAAAERVFGYSAEEAVGQPITLIIPPERLGEEEEIIRQLRAGRRVEHFESERMRKDGRTVPVALTISPLMDETGRVVGASKIARDISARRQSEQALRESEQRLRLALEAGHMGTWEWLLTTDQVLWSPALEAIHGLKPGTFPGTFKAYAADVHPGDRARVKESLQRALESGGEHYIEYRIIWPDGSLHWVEARGTVFRDDTGTPLRMMGVCIDVTDRKESEQALRESEARFRTLADSSPVLIWVNDLDGCEFVNRAYLDFLGVTSFDIQKFDWAQFLHPDERDRVLKTYMKAFDERGIYVLQHRFRRADGEYRWMKTVGLPRLSETGEFQGYIGSTFDTTDIKEAEEALREADKRKDEFLAVLGHELRNPLAAISTGTALLQGDPPADRRAWIDQMVARQVKQLERLVGDLLDVARVSHGKIELRKERVRLRDVVEASVAAVDDLVEQRRHELIVAMPPQEVFLEADPARLEQMLVNLLTNAAKYTPEGGKIWLSAERADGAVILRCKDTGVGLHPDVLESIFEPFTQTNLTQDRQIGGLGVGLSLVRQLAAMHGGSIEASSHGPGKGSEFTLRLPAVETERPGDSPARVDSSSLPKTNEPRRILVVDDNRDLAASLTALLENAGHQVSTAHDGETAIATALHVRPDIVLLDIGLPEMDGYAVAGKLRADPRCRDAMIAAMSGKHRQSKQGAPFDVYLTKPVTRDQLAELLEGGARPVEPAAGESQRILLIEDNKELARLTADLLRGYGQEVEIAFDGEQGCEQARSFQPDVVICDLKLPRMGGFEVAERLRGFPAKTPVLIGMTADITAPLQERVAQTPFDAFLSKPLVWSQLKDCIAECKAGREASSE